MIPADIARCPGKPEHLRTPEADDECGSCVRLRAWIQDLDSTRVVVGMVAPSGVPCPMWLRLVRVSARAAAGEDSPT